MIIQEHIQGDFLNARKPAELQAAPIHFDLSPPPRDHLLFIDYCEGQQRDAHSVKPKEVKNIKIAPKDLIRHLIQPMLKGQSPSADVDYQPEFGVMAVIIR